MRYKAINELLVIKAEEFKKEHGYGPLYWQLVKLARNAKDEVEKGTKIWRYTQKEFAKLYIPRCNTH
jgi:hypothetical protein